MKLPEPFGLFDVPLISICRFGPACRLATAVASLALAESVARALRVVEYR